MDISHFYNIASNGPRKGSISLYVVATGGLDDIKHIS